ncbi:hypothetical protein HYX19_02900 [Candidatus Woesearchaeota archaeon]|nr:hypothetical protein [Candidatus Woesearchaeota archaeon]
MKIIFATSNKHKVEEASAILKEYNIGVEHLNIRYNEARADTVEEVVKESITKLSNDLRLELVIEDTGIFFESYNNYPRPYPKMEFKKLGYRGILKLLKDENKGAYFKTIVGYCNHEKGPLLFDGILGGSISNEVFDLDKDVMPYERIFIPNGYDVTLSKLSREEKNKISHRSKAFKKFAEYYISKAGFDDLKEIVGVVRKKCPWDRSQTIETIAKSFADESKEVLEAIAKKDYANLKEELGDMLINILVIAGIAKDEGLFGIEDSLSEVYAKIIRRHPHVFGDKKAETPEDALKIWNSVKKEERKNE